MRDFIADVLSREGNFKYVTMIKTAATFHRRPTDYLLPGKILTPEVSAKLNRTLELAYQILMDETCPQCGLPLWLTHTVLGSVQFERFITKCWGCATKEGETNDGNTAKKLDLGPGESTYVLTTVPEGMTLPSRREAYAEREDDR